MRGLTDSGIGRPYGIWFKDAPKVPPAPDYTGAAQATATGNLEMARLNAKANRVNQVTPYGSITYRPGVNGDQDQWIMDQTLAPAQQQLLDSQNQTSLGLAGLMGRGVGYVNQALSHNITAADLPKSMINPGETGQDAIMRRLQPQIDQQHAALQTQLANQGIMPGSEAYNNAMRTQYQSENDLRSQAALQGITLGQNAQNQQLGLLSALQNNPINVLNAVRTGAQVTNPTFQNIPQQGMTAGADLLGATQAQGQYAKDRYNMLAQQYNDNGGALGPYFQAVMQIAKVAAAA